MTTTPDPSLCSYDLGFNDRILTASATFSLISNYQGSISVADPKNEIDSTYIMRRYDVDITVTSSICDDSEFDLQQRDCLSGNLKIASGVISNISYTIDAFGTRQADISFDSLFARLNSKSISTDPFLNLPANEVLGQLATIYLGIPQDLLDINTSPRLISGPAEGNNAFEEMRAIAQAGFSHLFVQTNGKLTSEPWLACEEAELEIPCAMIKSASRVINNELPPTVVRVRGASVQTFNCGDTEFTDARTSSVAGRSGYESAGGGLSKVVVTGIPQKDAEVSFFNLTGKKQDLYNANVATDGLTLSKITEVADGKYSFAVTDENGTFLGKGSKEFYAKISGKMTPDDFKSKKASGKNSKKDNVKTAKQVKRLSDVFRARPPIFESGPAFGSGVKDGIGHNDSENTSNEQSRTQLEVLVVDPALVSIYGIKEEQIENTYVQCKEDLFWIGLRRFQQWRMEQNAWELEIAPMSCLRINQMVTFVPPPSADFPNPTPVKGVISGISNNYSAESSSLTQKLTLLSVDTLCQTTYNSSNLINNLCGINGDGQWSGSGTSNQSMGSISNDCLFLYTKGLVGAAFVYLTQPCMEVNGSYTMTFEAEIVSGAIPQLAFKVADSSANTIASLAITSTGTYVVNFVATDTTCVFRWDLASVGNPNFWRIRNMQLFKSAVA